MSPDQGCPRIGCLRFCTSVGRGLFLVNSQASSHNQSEKIKKAEIRIWTKRNRVKRATWSYAKKKKAFMWSTLVQHKTHRDLWFKFCPVGSNVNLSTGSLSINSPCNYWTEEVAKVCYSEINWRSTNTKYCSTPGCIWCNVTLHTRCLDQLRMVSSVSSLWLV